MEINNLFRLNEFERVDDSPKCTPLLGSYLSSFVGGSTEFHLLRDQVQGGLRGSYPPQRFQ